MIIAQTFKVDLFDFEMRRMSVKQNWMSWDNTKYFTHNDTYIFESINKKILNSSTLHCISSPKKSFTNIINQQAGNECNKNQTL